MIIENGTMKDADTYTLQLLYTGGKKWIDTLSEEEEIKFFTDLIRGDFEGQVIEAVKHRRELSDAE